MSSSDGQYKVTMRNLAAAMRAQDEIAHPERSGGTARKRRITAESREVRTRDAKINAARYTHDMRRQNEAGRQTTQSAQDAGATNVGAPPDVEDTESWARDSTTLAGTETPPSEDEDGSNTPLEGSVLPSETEPISEDGSHAGTEATPPHFEDSNTFLEEFAQRSDHGFESGPDAGFLQGPGPHRFDIGNNNYYIGHIINNFFGRARAPVPSGSPTQGVRTQINNTFESPRDPASTGSTARRNASANCTTMPQQSTNSRPSEPSAAPDTSFRSVFGQALRNRTEQLLADRGAQETGKNTYYTEHIGGNATVQMGTRNGETGVFWGSGSHTADQGSSRPGTATQPSGDTAMTDASSSPTARGNYRRPAVEEGSDNGA
ncbi:hypothetical protein V865_006141 [Kwoniella europaea PYCC6329]|uniref:BZIP domain-containing protein n=1 Tax=Kwoniella europaea PYCC6329 TaxID=1423913 RepID=A0AAX4KNK7_9TREE